MIGYRFEMSSNRQFNLLHKLNQKMVHTLTCISTALHIPKRHVQWCIIIGNEAIRYRTTTTGYRTGFNGGDVVRVSSSDRRGQPPTPGGPGARQWRQPAGSSADGELRAVEPGVQPVVPGHQEQGRLVPPLVRPHRALGSLYQVLRRTHDSLLRPRLRLLP